MLLCATTSSLLVSRSYLAGGASRGDDHASHLAEILCIAHHLQAGRTDFWFDQNLLGYPLFLAYQPLPSFVMGMLVAVTEPFIDPLFIYKLSIVLLWGTMPVYWYAGGRWLGLERVPALAFGLLVLLVRDVWDFGLGFNGTARYGLYTQVWSTAIFPLALGSVCRFVLRQDIRAAVPVTFLVLCLLSHLICGVLCLVAASLLLIVRRQDLPLRAARVGILAASSLLLIGFWLVPFLLHAKYQGGFPYRWETSDGYPLSESILRLSRGELLDANRFPWLTLLAAAGVCGLAGRWRDLPTRWMFLFGTVCFLLWLGPATWGSAYRLLPLHQEMQVVRYVAGVQFALLFFAASGVRVLFLGLHKGLLALKSSRPRIPDMQILALAASTLTAVAWWNWLVIASFSWKTFDHRSADYSELVRTLSQSKDRFLCHERLETADQYHYNLLPLLADRPHVRTYGRGYHDSLSLYYLDHVQLSGHDFRIYNIRHLVSRNNHPTDPAGPLRLAWSNASYRVYETSWPGGFFEFIKVPLTIQATNLKAPRDLILEVAPILLERHALPAIGDVPETRDRLQVVGSGRFTYLVDGHPLVEQASLSRIKYELLRRFGSLQKPAGTVTRESIVGTEYQALVRAPDGGETLLLKASYHPYWHVTVDGTPARVLCIAPNLMAVEVPAGDHDVRFRYRNPLYQKVWFIASLAVGVVLWAASPVAARIRRLRIPRTEASSLRG